MMELVKTAINIENKKIENPIDDVMKNNLWYKVNNKICYFEELVSERELFIMFLKEELYKKFGLPYLESRLAFNGKSYGVIYSNQKDFESIRFSTYYILIKRDSIKDNKELVEEIKRLMICDLYSMTERNEILIESSDKAKLAPIPNIDGSFNEPLELRINKTDEYSRKYLLYAYNLDLRDIIGAIYQKRGYIPNHQLLSSIVDNNEVTKEKIKEMI